MLRNAFRRLEDKYFPSDDNENETSGKIPREKPLKRLVRRALMYLGLPLYIAAWVGFFVVVLKLPEPTYFSENALLPRLAPRNYEAHADFLRTATERVVKLCPTQNQQCDVPALFEFIAMQTRSIGIEAYTLHYNMSTPFDQPPRVHRTLYAVLRAGRASPVEALLVVLPVHWHSRHLLVAALDLLRNCRGHNYWAKDIYLVLSDNGAIGVQAWLAAYHGIKVPGLQTPPLLTHSGSIQAAIGLDQFDALHADTLVFSAVDIRYNMVNGKMPNLDLINLMVKSLQEQGVDVSQYGLPQTRLSRHYFYKPDRRASIVNSLAALWQQASGEGNGIHSAFGQYGIEAVTLTVYSRQGGDMYYANKLNVIIEEVLRSCNNLLEKFHQSFFFYFLPHINMYVSIGMYMPVLGLLLASVVCVVLSLWWQISMAIYYPLPPDHQENKVNRSLTGLLAYLIPAHVLGVCVYGLPYLLLRVSQFYRLPPDCGVWLALPMMFVLPVTLQRQLSDRERRAALLDKTYRPASAQLLRLLCCLELCIFLGVLGVCNVGQSLVLCALWVPVLGLLCRGSANRLRRGVTQLAVLCLNPLLLVVALALADAWLPSDRFAYQKGRAPFTRVSSVDVLLDPLLLLDLAVDTAVLVRTYYKRLLLHSYYMQSAMYSGITLLLLPVWTLFWCLANCPHEY